MFTRDNFESLVPSKTLARGLACFNERAVEHLEETTKGQWEAVVSGREDYEVEITLACKEVKAWSWDYDIEGSHAAIDELAASLIQQYPRRPAMRE